jgi:hypothetical protein
MWIGIDAFSVFATIRLDFGTWGCEFEVDRANGLPDGWLTFPR